MFAPNDTLLATIMLLVTMGCWGSWSSLRVLCRAEAPVFVVLYVSGQFVVGTFLSLTFGMIKGDNHFFDDRTFLGGLTHPGDWIRVLAIMIGGFCCANSDFLAACACTRLPFAVAIPIFMGWSLMQATILNYLIEGGADTDPYFLFAGVAAAFCAICCMGLSDSYAKEPETEFSSPISNVSMSFDGQSKAMQKALLSTDNTPYCLDDDDVNKALLENTSQEKGTNPWIFVCIFAGFISGLWSPLSTFGGKGSNPVDNPSVSLFFFQLGSVFAIPFMLFYYGRVIHVHEYNGNIPVACTTYFQEALTLPSSDKKYGFLAGGIVSMGSYMFFTASQALPSTVAFGIGSCAPLVTIAVGVFVFNQLKNAPFYQTFYIILSTILFITAISLMVLANLLS